MSKESCLDCRFSGSASLGLACRRRAPVIIPPSGGSVSLYSTIKTAWPSVETDDWCGDFQYKSVEQVLNDER